MASSLSTTSPPPGSTFFSWAGSKILQGKSLLGSLGRLGFCFCGFSCVSKAERQPTGVLSCTNRCFSWCLKHLDGWFYFFFLPFLLECVCGHRQLMKRTKERQCCKIIRKGKHCSNKCILLLKCHFQSYLQPLLFLTLALHWGQKIH